MIGERKAFLIIDFRIEDFSINFATGGDTK